MNVRKISHVVQISDELAMEYGIIPDTRPPVPKPTRRQRFRWWWRGCSFRLRAQLASWLVGYDVTDRDY